MQIQFGKNIADVRFYRRFADTELLCYLFIGAADT